MEVEHRVDEQGVHEEKKGNKKKEMNRRTITITISISISVSMCSSLITLSYLAVEVHDVNASDRQLAGRYSIGNSRAE